MQAVPARGVRKGTKSCTECRRRKVRCIPSFDDTRTCRRCEERGSECVAQTQASHSSRAQRLSSRQRISRLESKVSDLTEIVREMLKARASQSITPHISTEHSLNGCLAVSREFITNKPSHLRLLFENHSLKMEEVQENPLLASKAATSPACLLDAARMSLQRLIPSRVEVNKLAEKVSEWVTVLDSLFPLPSVARSRVEVVTLYGEMERPNVDPIRLASWLLNIVYMAEQLPQEATHRDGREPQHELSSQISDTVETAVLAHDNLIGSIQGLSTYMQYIRLQLGRGNIYGAWVKLRHVIAIAELIELPKMAQFSRDDHSVDSDSEGHVSKFQLWDLICAADRLLGMLLNLPSITSNRQHIPIFPVSIDGTVQTQTYFYHLTVIANKVHCLDQMSTYGPTRDVFSYASTLSQDLGILASQAPAAWWSGIVHGAQGVDLDHLVQILHFYVALRIHLPIALQQVPGNESPNSYFACRKACESLVQRFLYLGPRLPTGLFLSGIINVQVFTAAATLLLLSQPPSSIHSFDFVFDKSILRHKVSQVIGLLRERSLNSSPGSKLAKEGCDALCFLCDIFQSETPVDRSHLTFHIPFLGKVRVMWKPQCSQVTGANDVWPFQMLEGLDLESTTEQLVSPSVDSMGMIGPSFDGYAIWQDPIFQ
ncbi:hypothetical protein RU639_001369 [Aspergillus parasiticus]